MQCLIMLLIMQIHQVDSNEYKKKNNSIFRLLLDIVNCLLLNPIDKILQTLQLFLPLISNKTINEKLLNAYGEVLIYLDKNLQSIAYNDLDNQILFPAQQIFFFLQTNIYLKKLLTHIPKLIYLIQTKKFYAEEQQQQQPILQRYSSNRSQIQPLMSFSSENSSNSSMIQQLTRHPINDSGVDLTEPAGQTYFTPVMIQKKHSFVGKNSFITNTRTWNC